MADQNVKIYLIGIKIIIQGFSRSLITNLHSVFQNSKWRIQNGEPKFKKNLDPDENGYSGVFRVAECGLNNQNLRIFGSTVIAPLFWILKF